MTVLLPPISDNGFHPIATSKLVTTAVQLLSANVINIDVTRVLWKMLESCLALGECATCRHRECSEPFSLLLLPDPNSIRVFQDNVLLRNEVKLAAEATSHPSLARLRVSVSNVMQYVAQIERAPPGDELLTPVELLPACSRFGNLPGDVLVHICSFLPPTHIAPMAGCGHPYVRFLRSRRLVWLPLYALRPALLERLLSSLPGTPRKGWFDWKTRRESCESSESSDEHRTRSTSWTHLPDSWKQIHGTRLDDVLSDAHPPEDYVHDAFVEVLGADELESEPLRPRTSDGVSQPLADSEGEERRGEGQSFGGFPNDRDYSASDVVESKAAANELFVAVGEASNGGTNLRENAEGLNGGRNDFGGGGGGGGEGAGSGLSERKRVETQGVEQSLETNRGHCGDGVHCGKEEESDSSEPSLMPSSSPSSSGDHPAGASLHHRSFSEDLSLQMHRRGKNDSTPFPDTPSGHYPKSRRHHGDTAKGHRSAPHRMQSSAGKYDWTPKLLSRMQETLRRWHTFHLVEEYLNMMSPWMPHTRMEHSARSLGQGIMGNSRSEQREWVMAILTRIRHRSFAWRQLCKRCPFDWNVDRLSRPIIRKGWLCVPLYWLNCSSPGVPWTALL